MKRVLVTGGTGFLGSYLVKSLLERGAESVVVPTTNIKQKKSIDLLEVDSANLSIISGDIRDFDFLQRLFNEYEFDAVFHLGALSEVRKCQANAKLAYDINIGGTVNLLEVIRLYGKVNSIVVSSSDKAYGQAKVPYHEDQPLMGRAVYETSKSCQDLVAKSYHHNYDLPVVITRCCNLFGGGDLNFSRIIPNTIRNILNKKPPMIWSGAENFIRELLYVEDAVDAYLSLAENIETTKGNAYNIGSGEKTTIGELVKKILDLSSQDIDIEFRHRTFPEIDDQYLDSSKIKSHIDWVAKTKLEDGLKKTITYYENMFKNNII